MNASQPRSGQLPANTTPLQTPATVPAISNQGDQEYAGMPGRQIGSSTKLGVVQNFPRNDQATALDKDQIFPGDYIAGDALVCREIQMQ